MDAFFNITALRWLAPWVLTVLAWLPVPAVRYFLGAQKRGYEYGRDAFEDYVKRYGRFSGRIDLLTKMVGTKESQPLSDEDISNELGSLLVGATDTTVVVLTWLLWELAQRPGWQEGIRQELRTNKIDFATGITTYKQIAELPILNGFIMESMRLHPAQSIGLPRVARFDGEIIGGVKIPAGVRINLPDSRDVSNTIAIDLRFDPVSSYSSQPSHLSLSDQLPTGALDLYEWGYPRDERSVHHLVQRLEGLSWAICRDYGDQAARCWTYEPVEYENRARNDRRNYDAD